MNANDLIYKAYTLSGVLSPLDVMSADQVNDGLFYLQSLQDLWNIEGLLTFTTQVLPIPLVGNQKKYNIGPTGTDVTAQRPNEIIDAYLRIPNQLDLPLLEIDKREYDEISLKNLNGTLSGYFYYEPNFPNCDIYFYPIPNNGYTAYIRFSTYLISYNDLTTDINFPPGYQMFILYSLADELGRIFGNTRQDISQRANELKGIIVRNNEKEINDMPMDGRLPYFNGGYAGVTNSMAFLAGF